MLNIKIPPIHYNDNSSIEDLFLLILPFPISSAKIIECNCYREGAK
jgi:hypothetical protein